MVDLGSKKIQKSESAKIERSKDRIPNPEELSSVTPPLFIYDSNNIFVFFKTALFRILWCKCQYTKFWQSFELLTEFERGSIL